MGNAVRKKSLFSLSQEDISKYPEMKSMGITKCDVENEWKVLWERNEISENDQKWMNSTKVEIKWGLIAKHNIESSERFMNDAKIFQADGELEIAEVLIQTSLYIEDFFPLSGNEDREHRIKSGREVLDNIRREITSTQLEEEEKLIDLEKETVDPEKALERFQQSIHLIRPVFSRLSSELEDQQKLYLLEYQLRLDAAEMAQMYADQAFKSGHFNCAGYFYDMAYKLYGSAVFEHAAECCSGKGRVSTEKRKVLNFEEKEQIEIKFNIILISAQFPPVLSKYLQLLKARSKLEICDFFEAKFKGPTFLTISDSEISRRRSMGKASDEIEAYKKSSRSSSSLNLNVSVEDSPAVKQMISKLKKENAVLPFGRKSIKVPDAVKKPEGFKSATPDEQRVLLPMPSARDLGLIDHDALLHRPKIASSRRQPKKRRMPRQNKA